MSRLTNPFTEGLFHTFRGTLLLNIIGVVIWLVVVPESAMAVTQSPLLHSG